MSDTHSSAVPRDKTSYGIIPTQPSPSRSPPSLTQSESNSSSSPPQPTTPPPKANRSRTRYPDLGRVPLHRRGTSGTYERLEDLLREAGYKETRVYTPESERFDKPKEENDNRNSIAGSVVGFLTGLIPASSRQPSSLRESVSEDAFQNLSPPLSPLAGKRKQQTPSISSVEGLGPTPNGKVQSLDNISARLPPSPLPTSPHPYQQPIFHPRPSRASAYLRNMASHPNLKRPRSALEQRESILYESEEDLFHSRGNGEGEEEDPPPLPSTWLETVARAVLFGGVGAYIGGPQQPNDVDSPNDTTPALRQARSVMAKSNEHARHYSENVHSSSSSRKRTANNLGLYRSRSGLSDQTNRRPLTSASTFASSTSGFSTSAFSTRSLNPPQLLARVGRSRSERSVVEVSKTRVVCKSAPASRAASMSKERDGRPEIRRRASGKEKERREAKRGRTGKLESGISVDDVPTLARTRIEGDGLWQRVVTDPGGTRYLRGALSDSPESSASDDESSEDDTELDLARMLVPPKRQMSIKSLRKHLAAEGTASASLVAITERTAAGYGSGNSRTFRQWMANYKSPSDDWEDEIHGTSGGWGWPSGRRPRNRRGGSHEDVDDAASFLEFLQEDRNPSQRISTTRSTTSNKIRTALPTSFVEETS